MPTAAAPSPGPAALLLPTPAPAADAVLDRVAARIRQRLRAQQADPNSHTGDASHAASLVRPRPL